MNIILSFKLLQNTKDLKKFVTIVISGFVLILAILFIKYKPVYEVTVAGEKLGYIENVKNFKLLIEDKILRQKEQNIVSISMREEPRYQIKLLLRKSNVNEQEIIEKLKTSNTIVTYQYYEVSLNNEIKSNVPTLEEAEQIVNEIKEDFGGDGLELNLQINKYYTENMDDINEDTLDVASNVLKKGVLELKEEKEEEEALAIINQVKLSVLPVSGTITSRYGESSSIRKSTHTGIDIACSKGTDIKVVAEGTVTFAAMSGSYGNLVKVDHGNGVETWYGHCSKIYSKVGDKVKARDVIAAVGSTGNSTGPHLHFEIRIDSKTVNPQNYVY